MAAEDLQLTRGVRSALTRSAIDLTKTNFFARRGHVHLSGEAAVVGKHRPTADTAGALRAFESELRRLKEVKSVSFEFTNWARDSMGAWVCLERDPTPPGPAESANAPPPGPSGAPEPVGTPLASPRPGGVMAKAIPQSRVHVGVYADVAQADRAVWELVHAGIPKDRITVICPTCTHEKYEGLHKDQPSGSHTVAGATTGGAIGALLGGLAALIGVTASGGMGLFVAGPLLASGAGTGAVFGGFVGAMMTRGMEREVADFYDQALEKGKVLLAIEAGDDVSPDQVALADRIFAGTGAETVTLKRT